jgi:hypothetical protein
VHDVRLHRRLAESAVSLGASGRRDRLDRHVVLFHLSRSGAAQARGDASGVAGTAWEVHGGGFYHVEKFTSAPKDLPQDLIWFKWEAYLTFITGMALMVVQFYWNANAWMIDPAKLALLPWQAIAISLASLLVGWFVYDGLCRSPVGRNRRCSPGFCSSCCWPPLTAILRYSPAAAPWSISAPSSAH